MDVMEIEAAEEEAKRFLARVEALKNRRATKDIYAFQGCRESGALRRASLDLSRALSAMRNSRRF